MVSKMMCLRSDESYSYPSVFSQLASERVRTKEHCLGEETDTHRKQEAVIDTLLGCLRSHIESIQNQSNPFAITEDWLEPWKGFLSSLES